MSLIIFFQIKSYFLPKFLLSFGTLAFNFLPPKIMKLPYFLNSFETFLFMLAKHLIFIF